MAMHLMFGDMSEVNNKKEYVTDKLQAFFGTTKNEGMNVRAVLRRPLHCSPPMVKSADFPALDSNAQKAIDTSTKCFLNDINEIFSFAQGEEVVEDFVSYLSNDYEQYAPGTPLLRRKTNLATLYIIENNCRIENGRLIVNKPPESFVEEEMLGSKSTDLIVSFAEGLVGTIGGEIGSALMDAIFGTSKDIDFKELQKILAQIVKNANAEQTVQEQGGTINGIIMDIDTYYKERKTSGAKKQELYGYLRERETDINMSLGILQEKMFKEKGLSTFVAGANVLIAILQEMCLQDPNAKADNPKNSSNYKLITSDTKYFIKYVKEMHDKELDQRLKKVKKVYDNPFCPTGATTCKDEYYFKDDFTNKSYGPYEQCGKKDNPKKRANHDRKKLISKFKNEMKWMLDVTAAWQNVLKTPLGPE